MERDTFSGTEPWKAAGCGVDAGAAVMGETVGRGSDATEPIAVKGETFVRGSGPAAFLTVFGSTPGNRGRSCLLQVLKRVVSIYSMLGLRRSRRGG